MPRAVPPAKNRTSSFSIFLILCSTILVAFGQFFLKLGVTQVLPANLLTILNGQLILGCALYGISALMLIFSLKHGELSVIYPMVALTFVWVTLLSRFLLHEPVGPMRWVALVFVVAGVIVLGVSSR